LRVILISIFNMYLAPIPVKKRKTIFDQSISQSIRKQDEILPCRKVW